MGINSWKFLSWKSKAELEDEQKAYELWAFPHGQEQRDNLQALMLEIFPKENAASTLIPFLTCKEQYEKALKNGLAGHDALYFVIYKDSRLRHIVKKKDIPTYLALVIADAEMDERCKYPTADEIRESALEIARGHL